MVARQIDFFGGTSVTGSTVDKLTAILEDHPEARGCYKTAMVLYWTEYDGLRRVLGDRVDASRAWFFEQATSPKTLQNRVMEIQNDRPDLDAPDQIETWCQKQSRSGQVVR